VAAEAPWFCHELDCPTFTLLKNHTDMGIELRRYEPGVWASTNVQGVKYDKAVSTGFWRLFKYISGFNVEQQKVEMTAPVTVRVLPSQGPFCEDNFTISFFVPYAFQAKAPLPSDSTVFLECRGSMDVYAKSFGGWATGGAYLQEAADVTQKLESAGLSADTDHFYTAGYDSPFRLRNRHNEVWIPAKAAPSSSHTSHTSSSMAACMRHVQQQQQQQHTAQNVLQASAGWLQRMGLRLPSGGRRGGVAAA
jgi:hypothetical protein